MNLRTYTADEIRLQRERYLKHLDADQFKYPLENSPYWYRLDSMQPKKLDQMQLLMDTEIMAQAYLAEHPTDEHEPLTREWLLSVGFVVAPNPAWLRIVNGDLILSYSESANKVDPKWTWVLTHEQPGDPYDSNVPIPSPKTHGELRRLVTALGFALKESA